MSGQCAKTFWEKMNECLVPYGMACMTRQPMAVPSFELELGFYVIRLQDIKLALDAGVIEEDADDDDEAGQRFLNTMPAADRAAIEDTLQSM